MQMKSAERNNKALGATSNVRGGIVSLVKGFGAWTTAINQRMAKVGTVVSW